MKKVARWIVLISLMIGGGTTSIPKAIGQAPIKESPTGAIVTVTLSSDRQFLAVGGNRGIEVVDAATFDERWFGPVNSTARRLAFSPDGAFLVSVHWNGAVFLWDAQTGTQTSVLIESSGPFSSTNSAVAFSPDGLLAAYSQGKLGIWTIQALPPYASIRTVNLPPASFDWAPSGSKLLVGDDVRM